MVRYFRNSMMIGVFGVGTACWLLVQGAKSPEVKAAAANTTGIQVQAEQLGKLLLQSETQTLISNSSTPISAPNGVKSRIRELEYAAAASDTRMRTMWNEVTGELMLLSVRNSATPREDMPSLGDTSAAQIGKKWLDRIPSKPAHGKGWNLCKSPAKIGNRYVSFYQSGDRQAKVVLCAQSGRLLYVRLRTGTMGPDMASMERSLATSGRVNLRPLVPDMSLEQCFAKPDQG